MWKIFTEESERERMSEKPGCAAPLTDIGCLCNFPENDLMSLFNIPFPLSQTLGAHTLNDPKSLPAMHYELHIG